MKCKRKVVKGKGSVVKGSEGKKLSLKRQKGREKDEDGA